MSSAISVCNLAWDTNHFGFPCYRIELNKPCREDEFKDALTAAENAKLVFIVNKNCDIQNAETIGKLTTAFIADTNVQFVKAPCHVSGRSGLNAGDNYPYTQQLVDLANRVYIHSRFISDKKLAACGGTTVHSEWIKNAFSKAGKYFIVDRGEEEILSFVLFSVENDILMVELIATDESCRGVGVGSKLWLAVENEALRQNCSRIKAGTQLSNMSAVNFYVKMGCKLSGISQIYHFWR